MLDVKFIKENFKLVADNCVNRGVKVDLKKFLDLDEARRKMITKIEEMRAQRNTKSKTKPTEEEIKLMKEVGEEIKNLEVELKSINEEHKNLLYKIPNLSHPESPVGGEDKFTVVYEYGKPPKFDFTPKTHEQIMLDLDLVDFDRGTKVAGSKFYFVKNDAVRLNQALLNYGLDILEKHNFVLMETPDLAKEAILDGAGFNPRSEEESQIYSIENTDLKLIATAEIPLLIYQPDRKNMPLFPIVSGRKPALTEKPEKDCIGCTNLPNWKCLYIVNRKTAKNCTKNYWKLKKKFVKDWICIIA